MKLILSLLFGALLAIVTGAKLNSAHEPTTVVIIDHQGERVNPAHSRNQESDETAFDEQSDTEEMESMTIESQLQAPDAVAEFCDSLDLVSHPQLADDMVRLASAQYGTPSGLLNGIWETESNHDINGQTGSCNVMEQFAIRDCWKPGTTTRRPKGCESPFIFAGETASDTHWETPRNSVGNGTVQKQSIIRIAKALGIDPWSIKGSCGRSQLAGRPADRPTFGGCFGNMQITPSEWEKDVLAMEYPLSELTPFNICDSLLVSSYRLKKHHDQKLARYMKDPYWQKRQEEANQRSWLWSGRRYYGNPEGASSNRYEKHFKYGREGSSFSCGWQCWDQMKADEDFSPLTDYIRKRGNTVRKNRQYASN